MHSNVVRNVVSFLLVVILTFVAILGLSIMTRTSGEVSAKEVQTAVVADVGEDSKITATAHVPDRDKNVLLSISAFIVIISVPLLFFFFYRILRNKRPSFMKMHAKKYEPKADITFRNTSLGRSK